MCHVSGGERGYGERENRVRQTEVMTVKDTLSAEKTFKQGLKDLRDEVLQLSRGNGFLGGRKGQMQGLEARQCLHVCRTGQEAGVAGTE